VCGALDIKNASDALRDFPEDEKTLITVDTAGGPQKVLAVNEPGLYRLIFRSRKSDAEVFQKWVVTDVLPSIRKKGYYVLPNKGQIKELRRMADSGYISYKDLQEIMGLEYKDPLYYKRPMNNFEQSLLPCGPIERMSGLEIV
jgi:prophage antirepressor-like protein